MKNKKIAVLLIALVAILTIVVVGLLVYREYSPEDQEAAVVNGIVGMGVMGASESDEYRSPDEDRGGNFASVTFNWMEFLADTNPVNEGYYSGKKVTRDINFGDWADYGEPRREGFEYNWARSSQMAKHLEGQTSGLVSQVASGKVTHVTIFIGNNDFNTLPQYEQYGNFTTIYNGTTTDAQLQQKLADINADFNEAVDTLKAANPNVKIVVTTIGDSGLAPVNIAQYPNPSVEVQMNCLINNIPAGTAPCFKTGRLRVSYAIKDINTMLAQSLTPKGVYIADLNGWVLNLMSEIEGGFLDVDGIKINMTQKGNNPIYGQLADGIGHGGTVFNGLIANFIIESFNQGFQSNIQPFSECEIVANAGLKPLNECGPLPTPTKPPAGTATVAPSVGNTPTVTPSKTITPTSSTTTPTPSRGTTPSPTSIVPTTPGTTNTPIPTATIPVPTGNTIACGKADSDGDNKFTIGDFIEFAKVYRRNCNDTQANYGICGHRDADLNGTIEIADFISFAQRYAPRESCALQ